MTFTWPPIFTPNPQLESKRRLAENLERAIRFEFGGKRFCDEPPASDKPLPPEVGSVARVNSWFAANGIGWRMKLETTVANRKATLSFEGFTYRFTL